MDICKGKLIGLSCTAAAVIFCVSGYAVSALSFDKFKAHAEKEAARIINTYAGFNEREAVTVALHETGDLFLGRKLNVVAANRSGSLQIPVELRMGWFGYEFIPDLKSGRVNDDNMLKFAELYSLTDINSAVKFDMLSGSVSVSVNTEYLNDLNALVGAVPIEGRENFVTDSAAGAAKLGFSRIGSAELEAVLDGDGTLHTYGEIRNFVGDSFSVGRSSFKTVSESFLTGNSDKGSLEIEFENMPYLRMDEYPAGSEYTDSIRKATIRMFTDDADEKGNFSADYSISISNTDNMEDLCLKGQITGLNRNIVPLLGGDLWSLIGYFAENPMRISFDQGSSFMLSEVVPKKPGTNGKDSLKHIGMSLNGYFGTVAGKEGTSLSGEFTFTADRAPASFRSLSEFTDYFEQAKNGSYVSELKFLIPFFSGEAEFYVNGRSTSGN